MQKQELRARMKALRAACIDREERNARIFEQLFSQPCMQADSFFVYRSFGTEADTHKITNELLRRGKRVYLPRVTGRDMALIRYENQPFVKGAFGVDEPCGKACNDSFEVCILPLLAADRRLARLGYGGGYYDRYLADKPAFRIGLAYSFQLLSEIPTESTDVFLDALVTDEKVLYRRK